MSGGTNMECHDARPLIPSYLDGEVTEAQAAPLRKHLLDCQPCRASAQSDKNLKRWFAAPAPVTVPRDFAARVARRAFAGDRGERFSEPALAAVPMVRPARAADEGHLRFVLTLTALAAGLLVVLSLAIRSSTLPSGAHLMADDQTTLSVDEALQRLDALNRSTERVDRPALDAAPLAPPKDAR